MRKDSVRAMRRDSKHLLQGIRQARKSFKVPIGKQRAQLVTADSSLQKNVEALQLGRRPWRRQLWQMRDDLLSALLRPDSKLRCGIFTMNTLAVWYLAIAAPYEVGWPEDMRNVVPLRELCRAGYVLDLIMTMLQTGFELDDSEEDMRSSFTRIDTRVWLPLDFLIVLPYDIFAEGYEWAAVARLPMLVKVAAATPAAPAFDCTPHHRLLQHICGQLSCPARVLSHSRACPRVFCPGGKAPLPMVQRPRSGSSQ
eukprot:7389354-Prymnesium_polylepis.1